MSTPRTVGVHDAKTHFSRLLHEVEAGEEVLVTRGGEPVARIVPTGPTSRIADSRGMFPGSFPLTDDFDAGQDELGDLFGLPR